MKDPGPDAPASAAAPSDARAAVSLVRLEDVVANVGHLAGELVHALRNPISALTTSLELLTGGLADAEDVPQLHRVMRNELTRMNELLGRCRELTRLAAIARAPGDFAALVRARVEARGREIAERRVALTLALPAAPVPVLADDAQLGGALDALVTNALEAMPDGGALAVTLVADGASGQATLTVADTGRGIAPEALPNVFRLFYTTRKGAAGLGLSVARQVLFAHGGTIALASEPGRGTTVTVRLPTA